MICGSTASAIVPFTRRPVIETVIVYEPDSGTIEVIGSIKKLRERLAKAFAETKLGVAIPAERLPRRRFDLTPLLDPQHVLAVDPSDGIARVKLTMIMLSNWDNGLTQQFEIPFEDNETTLHEALAAQYGAAQSAALIPASGVRTDRRAVSAATWATHGQEGVGDDHQREQVQPSRQDGAGASHPRSLSS